MKVFFVGHFGARNLGDELLLTSQMDLFNEHSEESLVSFVYSYNMETDYYSQYPYKVKLVTGFSFKKLIKSIRETIETVNQSDCVIVGGGGIIQDKYFVYRPLSTLLPAFIAFILNKPVYGFSLGIYKLNFFLNKRLVRTFLKHANHVTYRDSASNDSIEELIPNKSRENISYLPDSALGLKFIGEKVESDFVLVAIREVFIDYIEILKDIIFATLKDKKVNKVKLVTFENTDEEHSILNLLYKELEPYCLVEIIKFPAVLDYLDFINSSTKVIAGRLHACIPAYVLGKEVLGLAYEEKVSDFCYSHGIEYALIENLKNIQKHNIAQPTLEVERNLLANYVAFIKNDIKKYKKKRLLKKIYFIAVLLVVAFSNFMIHWLKINYRKER